MNIPNDLMPGDMILYYTPCLLDDIIAEKTGMEVGHVEIYAGNNQSMASREGGVNLYPFRDDHIICIRRPVQKLNWQSGMDWFNGIAKGQGYDVKGLFCFTSFVHEGEDGKMFCSEFALNFYRACLIEPCNPIQRSDHTSPRDLWILGSFQTIFHSEAQYG